MRIYALVIKESIFYSLLVYVGILKAVNFFCYNLGNCIYNILVSIVKKVTIFLFGPMWFSGHKY